MCYILNQDIYLLIDNKAYEMKRRRIRCIPGVSSFLFAGIGGVERGKSTGTGADDGSI